MAKQRLPRGMARRDETVTKIVGAYDALGERALSFSQLREMTGLSKSSLTDALRELRELGCLHRDVTDEREVYYVLVEGLSDEEVEALAEEYEREYELTQNLLGYPYRLKHEAKRRGLELIRQAYTTPPSMPRLRHVFEHNREELKKLYYIELRDCLRSLRQDIYRAYKASRRREWEKCCYCRYGKRLYRQDLVRCTRRWAEGVRDAEHPPDHYCDEFEMKLPKI